MSIIPIYKIIKKIINGIQIDMVLISIDDYRLITGDNKSIGELEDILLKEEIERTKEAEKIRIEEESAKLRIEEEAEKLRIEEIERRDAEDKLINSKIEEKEKKNIEIRKLQNANIRKQKDELLNEYKHITDAKIKKCSFCNNYRVYPVHFLDENNKQYTRDYTKEKQKLKSVCCMNCYQDAEQKKSDYYRNNTEHCTICNCTYIALSDNMIVAHLNSTKHKKNDSKRKDIINLSLLSIKELQKICSKTLNENGTYLINNYTRIKKNDLLVIMNDNYHLLVFN